MTTYITISDYLSLGGVLKEGQEILNHKGDPRGIYTGVTDGAGYMQFVSDDMLAHNSCCYIEIPVIPSFAIDKLIEKYDRLYAISDSFNIDILNFLLDLKRLTKQS